MNGFREIMQQGSLIHPHTIGSKESWGCSGGDSQRRTKSSWIGLQSSCSEGFCSSTWFSCTVLVHRLSSTPFTLVSCQCTSLSTDQRRLHMSGVWNCGTSTGSARFIFTMLWWRIMWLIQIKGIQSDGVSIFTSQCFSCKTTSTCFTLQSNTWFLSLRSSIGGLCSVGWEWTESILSLGFWKMKRSSLVTINGQGTSSLALDSSDSQMRFNLK